MDPVESIKTTPIATQKTVRPDNIRALTSAYAGKIVPVAVMPLLREDSVRNGNLRIRLEMAETPKPLMNAVSVKAQAHFVPFLAFPHFEGSLDQLNRSYKGQPQVDGGSVVPFFPTITYDEAAEFWQTLGIHGNYGDNVNASYLHAYNVLVNHRYKARSKSLPQRLMNDTSLATCFWQNGAFRDVVPDFDQAKIDGELDLNINSANLPVKGIGFSTSVSLTGPTGTIRETGGGTTTYTKARDAGDPGGAQLFVEEDSANPGFPGIFAELAAQGITLSLANIDLARKTAAFAEIRKQMNGIDDDHIIDLLMDGIRVPDEMMKQPILLDSRSTIFGYAQRYASDGGNLDQSVTRGETFVDLRFRTPPMNTGGIIIVTVEIVPEQLFERQADPLLYAYNPSELPSYVRDYLDPEKVEIVKNYDVDVSHTDPLTTFGYRPLNAKWRRSIPAMGGKFYRDALDVFSEDRQRIWEVETDNPTLTTDFYLASGIHHGVFADTLSPPFEILTVGGAQIIGDTVFGKLLDEDTGDYDAIMEDVDTTRIDQTA